MRMFLERSIQGGSPTLNAVPPWWKYRKLQSQHLEVEAEGSWGVFEASLVYTRSSRSTRRYTVSACLKTNQLTKTSEPKRILTSLNCSYPVFHRSDYQSNGYAVCTGEAAKQGAGCLFLRIDMLVPGGGVVLILKWGIRTNMLGFHIRSFVEVLGGGLVR